MAVAYLKNGSNQVYIIYKPEPKLGSVYLKMLIIFAKLLVVYLTLSFAFSAISIEKDSDDK